MKRVYENPLVTIAKAALKGERVVYYEGTILPFEWFFSVLFGVILVEL